VSLLGSDSATLSALVTSGPGATAGFVTGAQPAGTPAAGMLLHDARPAGANGKKSAGPPIIHDAPDIVEAGDQMERLPLSHAAD
jgi:hypothetical protein